MLKDQDLMVYLIPAVPHFPEAMVHLEVRDPQTLKTSRDVKEVKDVQNLVDQESIEVIIRVPGVIPDTLNLLNANLRLFRVADGVWLTMRVKHNMS